MSIIFLLKRISLNDIFRPEYGYGNKLPSVASKCKHGKIFENRATRIFQKPTDISFDSHIPRLECVKKKKGLSSEIP